MCDRSPSKAVAARYSAGQQVAVVGSEIRLFGKNKGVVYLDPEITNRAFQFRVSKQELAGAQIAGSLVEERDLCPPEAVGPDAAGSSPIRAAQSPNKRPYWRVIR